MAKLIVLLLSLTASGKAKGVEGKSGEFFRNARRSGLWPDAEAASRSAISKARKKLPADVLENLLHKAVNLAYEAWPESPEFHWHGMLVAAMDLSKFTMPATKEIRDEFDPNSGLEHSGKGHYPQCNVCTLYDVFRRFPIARVIASVHESERDLAIKLLPFVRPKSMLIFDRGYPSYEFLLNLLTDFSGHFLIRCPSRSTFPAVEAFVASGRLEDVIFIDPSLGFTQRVSVEERKSLRPIRVRAIRLVSPTGVVSVLLTNLFDRDEFPMQQMIDLYWRRWEIETAYRHDKQTLEIQEFHGRTCNSIRQELYAAAIMTVIARTLMMVSQAVFEDSHEPQFKNAIMSLASDAAVLAADDPERAVAVFEELLQEIYRVPYYRPKRPRPSQQRVTKRPLNKWALSKAKVVHHP